jgi:hypothetical protein
MVNYSAITHKQRASNDNDDRFAVIYIARCAGPFRLGYKVKKVQVSVYIFWNLNKVRRHF